MLLLISGSFNLLNNKAQSDYILCLNALNGRINIVLIHDLFYHLVYLDEPKGRSKYLRVSIYGEEETYNKKCNRK